MEADKAAAELKAIRELMERPVRYSTQSGLSGIIAGLAALAGCFLDAHFTNLYSADRFAVTAANTCVWAGVLLVAFAGVTICTRLRERGRGMPFWSDVKKRILWTILPPFVAGAGITLAIVYRWWVREGPNMWGLIPAIWMLFYGVACWQVGEFSVKEIRILGVAFILAGLITGAFFHYDIPGVTTALEEGLRGFSLGMPRGYAPYVTLGATFGGFHIIYGVIVWIRHGG